MVAHDAASDGHKVCSKCRVLKPLSEFYAIDVYYPGQPDSDCKACGLAYQREWKARNPEKIAEYRARDKAKHRERMASDPEYAAREREMQRIRSARNRRPRTPTPCRDCQRPKERKGARYCDACREARKPQPKPRSQYVYTKVASCPDCGATFIKVTRTTRCRDCQDRAYRESERERSKTPESLAQKRRRFRERYATDPEFRARVKAKQKRHEYRRRGARRALPYRAVEIFERDNWTCHLCGKRVNRLRRWPDQMCASIDHIIPLVEGGEDSPDNVKLAHWLCNTRRGARPVEAVVA